jgi:Tfp pilus assembly protein FimT
MRKDKIFFVINAAVWSISTFYFSAAYAASSECRTAALPDGTPAMFCKDKNGNWKQQAGEVTIAPSSRADIAAVPLSADAKYSGVAVYQVPIKTRQRAVRGLTDFLTNSLQPTTQRQEILATTVMRIEGGTVTGTITGGGWRTNVPITGTRKNGICNISGTLNGESVAYIGKCDESGFTGKMTTFAANGGSLKGDFHLETVSFVDTSVRDSKRADLKARCEGGSNTACVELDQAK